MANYLATRFISFIPVLFVVSLIIFGVMRIIPGDPAAIILSGGGTESVDPEELAALQHKLGIDRPYVTQYVDWIKGVFTFDFGDSFATPPRTVIDILKRSFPITLQLAVMAVLLGWCIAFPVGILSAIRQDTWLDYFLRTPTILGVTIPSFWSATLVVVMLVLFFKWIPPLIYVNPVEDLLQNLKQMVWPAMILGVHLAAPIARLIRSAFLDVRREDYIRTAWSKGLAEYQVVTRHMIKNAMPPVVAFSALQFGFLLGNSVIVETIFKVPGLGFQLFDALSLRDFNVIQAILLLFALKFLVINFVADLTVAWMDPRVRLR